MKERRDTYAKRREHQVQRHYGGNTWCVQGTKERPEWRSARDHELARYERSWKGRQRADHTRPCRTTKDYVFIIRAMGSHCDVTQWVWKVFQSSIWGMENRLEGRGSECAKMRTPVRGHCRIQARGASGLNYGSNRAGERWSCHSHTIKKPTALRFKARPVWLRSPCFSLLCHLFVNYKSSTLCQACARCWGYSHEQNRQLFSWNLQFRH